MFPDDYRPDTPYMDYVCNIIGNALPCDFAEATLRQCPQHLQLHPHQLSSIPAD